VLGIGDLKEYYTGIGDNKKVLGIGDNKRVLHRDRRLQRVLKRVMLYK